ncbi:MAG: NAD(P)H-dependent oxidoreductase [Gammaproteobacteria bacterium]|nr:NAD(P)H-dependent oxidoreductase [Gammaproteobacteria bacterium]NNC98191.1 NAD(P)H-dependent oxidoreductase [Gammaproteobacteria bacterium]NNM14861.1 NAD(P)H-dependent oxidoreductase [Gammaproteobacteria bacterium]
MKNILVIQGHPDPFARHYCHALADAFSQGARDSGHQLKTIEVAKLNFPLIHSQDEFENTSPPEDISNAQSLIRQAEHIAIFFPLWLGTMPASFKGFLEQVFRPNFGFDISDPEKMPKKLLKGKSAHIYVTMGMPAIMYKRYFGAHGMKNLEHNILAFSGIKPVEFSMIGMIENKSDKKRDKWLKKARSYGQAGG